MEGKKAAAAEAEEAAADVWATAEAAGVVEVAAVVGKEAAAAEAVAAAAQAQEAEAENEELEQEGAQQEAAEAPGEAEEEAAVVARAAVAEKAAAERTASRAIRSSRLSRLRGGLSAGSSGDAAPGCPAAATATGAVHRSEVQPSLVAWGLRLRLDPYPGGTAASVNMAPSLKCWPRPPHAPAPVHGPRR